jgi:hypothetical protein
MSEGTEKLEFLQAELSRVAATTSRAFLPGRLEPAIINISFLLFV